MPLNSRLRLASVFNRTTALQSICLVLCILFGSALILNSQTANDGGWYWYAYYLQHGRHLYSDMHLPLQPLFIMLTSANLTLFGKSWLASKIPAFVQLVAYCAALFLILRSSRLSDSWKALILTSAFFITNSFEAYRLDDYHILADCLEAWSIVCLLCIPRVQASRKHFLVGVIGVVSGLCTMDRLNDGAALFLGAAISLLCLLPSERLLSLSLYVSSYALTAVVVVFLTGDSLHDWAKFSIFHAAATKGGSGSVLMHPFQLPMNAVLFLYDRQRFEFTVYLLGCAGIFAVLIAPFLLDRRRSNAWKCIAGIIFILLPVQHFRRREFLSANSQDVMLNLSAVLEPLVYALGTAVFIRFLYWAFSPNRMRDWDRREILLVIPLGELIGGAMSSGGKHYGLFVPLATTILLLAVASPLKLRWQPMKSFAVGLLLILTAQCAVFKYSHPYRWHSYRSEPMFVDRHWYHHPVYGPMVIDGNLLRFVLPICAYIDQAGGEKQLLSMPYPYANYFCVIPPWHGYVQTFFDTSTGETIFGLIQELKTAPPAWVLYQRQLGNLSFHEQVYNRGQPLPHRYLDHLIEDKIAQGEWHPVYTSRFGSLNLAEPFSDYNWTLIRTR